MRMRKLPDPFYMVPCLLLCFGCIFIWATLPGCQAPEQKWKVACNTYSSTMTALTALHQADMLDEETCKAIDIFAPMALKQLEVWKAMIAEGQDPSVAIDAFNQALDILIQQRINALLREEPK